MKDNRTDDWTVTDNMIGVNWSYNSSHAIKANGTLVLDSMSAPKDFSYHCSTFKIKSIGANETANFTLTFDGLQVWIL